MPRFLRFPAVAPTVLLLLGAAWLGPGCASSLPSVLVEDAKWAQARWPGTTAEDLARGRDVFGAACTGCHALPSPVVSDEDGWPGIVREMGKRARIGSTDQELVSRYLAASSRRLRGVR